MTTFAGLNFGCFELSTYFSKGTAKKKKKRIPDFIALLKLVVDAEKQQRLDELYAKYLKRETSKDELFSEIRRIAGRRTTSTVFSLMDDTSNQELSVDQKLALYKLLTGVDKSKLEDPLDLNTALERNRILRECLAIIGEGVPLNDELLLKACKQLKFRERAARNWIKALQHYKLVHETTVNLRELDLNDKSVEISELTNN